MKIVFVCTGNTCRSPMAEYLFRDMVDGTDLAHLDVVSAGTSARQGGPVAANTRQILEEHDINGSKLHQTTPVSSIDWQQADLALTMTRGHASRIEHLEDSGVTVSLLTEYVDQSGNISDPVGRSIDVYRDLYDELEGYLGQLEDELISQAND